MKIPIYQPLLDGNEKKYVNDCIDSNWISSKGSYVEAFEENFAKYTQVNYAASCCNGTTALHLALLALGIGEGDEVIVPTLTYISSVNAISYTGATPVFIDSDIESWQLDPKKIEKLITSRTKAVMAVHLYGQACPMKEIQDICSGHNLLLIEDCAEALGTKIGDKHVSSFGDISTYSFYGNKTITTGEGGMVVSNDKTLIDRVSHYKGQGLAKYREYWHDVVGYNYRMTNICAAIGLGQLERIEEKLAAKREIAQKYQEAFNGTPVSFHSEQPGTTHSYWMCSILVPETELRDQLREHLKDNGVETRPVFYPIHTMPMYANRFSKFPNAEYIGWRGINLPSYPGLEKKDIDLICTLILNFINAS